MIKNQYTNSLIGESSPYLLQHAHNPVDWYPWGSLALKKARDEDKLILISIGYSACHWCHVMETESFEDEGIAEIMNKNFVCIKVDREERPDIDQIYMEAVQIMNGSGGWPLNCFALPDGRPVYGGTYYRPQQWIQLLMGLSASYLDDKSKFVRFAEELHKGILDAEIIGMIPQMDNPINEDLDEIVEPWRIQFDSIEGGSKRAPKFPMPGSYLFLLNYYYYSQDRSILAHLNLTLDKMAGGGIYDHIGGGFARYSVDKYWHVPHFEKMLYDNAQLVSLYSKAYQFTKNELYKRVVYQTIEFVERELKSPDGAFYSSLDADSEGEEGKYYVWTKQEIDEILGGDSDLFCGYYNITYAGNWEKDKNIPNCKMSVSEAATKFNLSEAELFEKIDSLNKILLNKREKRIKPGLDNKILSSWNALMMKGYLDAFRAFDENIFLEKALLNADFLTNKVINPDYKLWRNFKNDSATINGFLDDYAFSIESFIAMYQATFDEKWIWLSKNLCDYTIEHFYDKNSGMFFYTSDQDEQLIVRKKEIQDNVIPASNSVMANNLFDLGVYFYEQSFLDKSSKMLANVKNEIKRSGPFYYNWAGLLAKFVHNPFEISIIGYDLKGMRAEFDKNYIPFALFAGSMVNSKLPMLEDKTLKDKSTIYICKNRVCKKPVYSVKDALALIEQTD
jgi:uncharacterized protein YyaL (SSP411 family)